VGISVLFALLFVGAWDVVPSDSKQLRYVVCVVTALYFLANVYVLRYRSSWFGIAADANESVLRQLENEMKTLPGGSDILLVDLPDYIEYVIAFGNTFPSAGKVLNYDLDVRPIYDRELAGLSSQERHQYIRTRKTPSTVVYWYTDGTLVPEG
jgi:hypothetical protein